MFRVVLIFVGLIAVLQPINAEIWALLAAGGIMPGWGYLNYAIEANVFGAYQMLHANGIPDERIVVMAYDDIANNPSNPHKGVIINQPHGPNVYKNALKDYTGKAVNPKNFLKILNGDSEGMKGIGSGKVIKSGPNDHVLVFLMDHGGYNTICFPFGSVLHAVDLQKTLQKMSSDKKFSQMTFYIDACESGSMFRNHLPDNINVYGVSSASSSQSTYAVFCNYTSHRICIASEFTYSWLRDTRQQNLSSENLSTQFQHIKTGMKEVLASGSTPQQFGDKTITKDTASAFEGSSKPRVEPKLSSENMAVPLNDLPYQLLLRDIEEANDIMETTKLVQERRRIDSMRRLVDDFVKVLVDSIPLFQPDFKVDHQTLNLPPKDHKNPECYKNMLDAFLRCFPLEKMRRLVDDFVKVLVDSIPLFQLDFKVDHQTLNLPPKDHKNPECYKNMLDAFLRCFSLEKNFYARKHWPLLGNLCESGVKEESFRAVMLFACRGGLFQHETIY